MLCEYLHGFIILSIRLYENKLTSFAFINSAHLRLSAF